MSGPGVVTPAFVHSRKGNKTNLVSELRRPRPHPVAFAWIEDVVEEGLYLCAVTIGEI